MAAEREAEVVSLGTLGTRPCDSDKLIRPLQARGTPLHVVYEAGPCGYWGYRDLRKQKLTYWVVAPSQMPKQAGERGKTERREAAQLARLLRSGDRTPVYGPAVEDEASRALVRGRADTLKDGKAAKARRKAFLLRQDIGYEGRATWGPAPLRWLAKGGCPTPAQPSMGRTLSPKAGLSTNKPIASGACKTWCARPKPSATSCSRRLTPLPRRHQPEPHCLSGVPWEVSFGWRLDKSARCLSIT